MKKKLIVTAIVLLISVSIFSLVAAEFSLAAAGGSQPQGTNSSDWNGHMATDHDEHQGGHRHVGADADCNGDRYTCGKHAGRDVHIHVHTGNNNPN